MTVYIEKIDKPLNVTATLTAGGSLAPNTTYYVRVIIKGTLYLRDARYGNAESPASDEISFTTDSTNLSATISWDSLTGNDLSANNTFFVFVSDTSGVYNNKKVNRRYYNNVPDSSTSYDLTTYDGLYTASAYTYIMGFLTEEFYGLMATQMPYNFQNIWLNGRVRVYWTGEADLQDIYDKAVTDGLTDWIKYDGYNFSILGIFGWYSGDASSEITFTGGYLQDKNVLFYGATGLASDNSNLNLVFGKENTDIPYQTSCNVSFMAPTQLYNYGLSNLKGKFTINGGRFYSNLWYTLSGIGDFTFKYCQVEIKALQSPTTVSLHNLTFILSRSSQFYSGGFRDCRILYPSSGYIFSMAYYWISYRTEFHWLGTYPFGQVSAYMHATSVDDWFQSTNNFFPTTIRWNSNYVGDIKYYTSMHFTTTPGAKIVIQNNDGSNASLFEYNLSDKEMGSEITDGYITADSNGIAKVYVYSVFQEWGGGDNYSTSTTEFGDFTITISADDKATTILENITPSSEKKIFSPLQEGQKLNLNSEGELNYLFNASNKLSLIKIGD